MKFAMMDREIRLFLREQQLPKFDPYKFTPAMTEALVGMLLAAQDVETEQLEAVVGHSHRPSSTWHQQPVFMLVLGLLAGAGLMGLFGY